MNPDVSFTGGSASQRSSSTYTSSSSSNALPTSQKINQQQMEQLEKQGHKIPVGEAQLIKAIDRALKALEGPETAFEVAVHKETHSIMVKVLNKETGEIIREIPPEKTLDLVAKMMEFAGIIIDEKI
ncbi:flagellar protein FlaG [Paenibacillus taichungensis]